MSAGLQGFPGTVVTQFKGGVTKTTVSLNVAYHLAQRGHEVAIIDLGARSSRFERRFRWTS